MALHGRFEAILEQLPRPERVAMAVDYLRRVFRAGTEDHARLLGLAVGETRRVELGEGCFALEQAYLSKPWAEGRFESHRAYIDIQAVVEGVETMGVRDCEGLMVAEDLTPEKDLVFYAATAEASRWRVAAGEITVFFPADAHLPSVVWGEAGLVRKTVLKIPVDQW
jgi:YhcH/YjgK/YiaL family protein